MSLIGIDFGTAGSVMASVRRGKVEVLRNEVSERFTPAVVGYQRTGERVAGDVAASTMTSNLGSSCRNFKHLLGLNADNVVLQSQERYTTTQVEPCQGGHLAYKVENADDPVPVALAVSIFLQKLRGAALTFLESPLIAGAVVSRPLSYGPSRISALEAAFEVSGIRLLLSVKENVAVALDYGIFRRTNFDAVIPTTTAFVNIGHGTTWVSVVQFTSQYAKVIASAYADVGGRDIDVLLVDSMISMFQKTSGLKICPVKHKKATLKLENIATKTKKTLSANSQTTFGLECLHEGEDFAGSLTLTEFNELIEPVAERVRDMLESFRQSLPSDVDISTVELVGNGSRVPCLMNVVKDVFAPQPVQRTLSSDETVAKGCALVAAQHSPAIRMKHYPVFEEHQYVPEVLKRAPPEPKKTEPFKAGFFNKKKEETPVDGEEVPKDEAKDSRTPEEGEEVDVSPTGASAQTLPESEGAREEEPTQQVEEEPIVDIPTPPDGIAVEVEVEAACGAAEKVLPGWIRAWAQLDKKQRQADEAANRRATAINSFEGDIFRFRNAAESTWLTEISQERRRVIIDMCNESESWLWDHMEEHFAVYEDRHEVMKNVVRENGPPPPKPEEPKPEERKLEEEEAVEQPEGATEETK